MEVASHFKVKEEDTSEPEENTKTCRAPPERSRTDTALSLLTQKFRDLLSQSADGILDLNLVAQDLQVSKRRLYDVTNVLDGINLIKKKSKNLIQWLGKPLEEVIEDGLRDLIVEERNLDEQIQSCVDDISRLTEGSHFQKFAYLTHEDVRRILLLDEQTVLFIKAPAHTKIAVPHPDESLQVHMRSIKGPINVYVYYDAGDCSHDQLNFATSSPDVSLPLPHAQMPSEEDGVKPTQASTALFPSEKECHGATSSSRSLNGGDYPSDVSMDAGGAEQF